MLKKENKLDLLMGSLGQIDLAMVGQASNDILLLGFHF